MMSAAFDYPLTAKAAMAEALRAIPALPLYNFRLPAQGQLGHVALTDLRAATASEHLRKTSMSHDT
jgi:hypothetical protein